VLSACKSCACLVTQLTNKHTHTCTHCMHDYVYVYAIKHVCTFQCVCAIRHGSACRCVFICFVCVDWLHVHMCVCKCMVHVFIHAYI